MCGRFSLTDPDRLEREFARRFAFSQARFRARYNIAPTQDVLAVRNDGRHVVESMRWGIHERINARADRVLGNRLRCVIFADGFYEWKAKRPTLFTLRDGVPFAFAGIWSPGRDGASCAIITTEANELTAQVHDRMPVILRDDAIDTWLREDALGLEVARELLRPFPAAEMTARPVSSRLNSATYDASDILVDDEPRQGSLF